MEQESTSTSCSGKELFKVKFFTKHKIFTKIIIICFALLLFQIPLSMVGHLIFNREKNAENVKNEICSNWGLKQKIQLSAVSANPNEEIITADVFPEIRYRGIYQAVIYTADIKIIAHYKNIPKECDAYLEISDKNGITAIEINVNGEMVKFENDVARVRFPLPAGDSVCAITVKLKGSESLSFIPGSDNTKITISGIWNAPSFFGTTLPDERLIEKDHFGAEWSFNAFNRRNAEAGVNLCLSAGTYQQVERTFRYATFFLIIFFFTLLAGEVITRVNIHILQYFIAAGAPVLFYLMTLAFSEQFGFVVGYAVSAVIIVSMVTMYCRMFFGKNCPALIMGGIFALSYILNYVILQMEDMALLSGTIVLAIILGVLMLLTGKMNSQEITDCR